MWVAHPHMAWPWPAHGDVNARAQTERRLQITARVRVPPAAATGETDGTVTLRAAVVRDTSKAPPPGQSFISWYSAPGVGSGAVACLCQRGTVCGPRGFRASLIIQPTCLAVRFFTAFSQPIHTIVSYLLLIHGSLVSLTKFLGSCVQAGCKLTARFSSLSSLLSSTSTFSQLRATLAGPLLKPQ